MKSWTLPGALLLTAFLVARLPALQLHHYDSDINIYAHYAAEWHAAGSEGVSFYEIHRRHVEADIAQAATPAQAAALRDYMSVEYPPLAVAVMALPAYFVADPFLPAEGTGPPPRYARAFMAMMVLFDAAVLLLVVFLVRRLFPADSPLEQCERCLVYVVGTLPLYGLLYTRLDLGVALAVLGSLALLVSRRHWWVALLVLALGVHFKLMPVFLAPVFLVGALPAAALAATPANLIRALGRRAALLAAFGLAILAFFFVTQGGGILDFLGYHKDRGIEIESTWSTLQLIMGYFGGRWELYHSHGSINVRSALTPAATAAMLSLVLAASLMFFVVARRQSAVGDGTVAQEQPRLVAGFALLVMLLSIVANKVFSPQYMLWILPLVPLVDFRPAGRRWFFAGALAASYFTMRIFPDCFVGDIVSSVGTDGDMPTFYGPTPYGAFLLLARNGLCLALTAFLARSYLLALRPSSADNTLRRALPA